MLQSCFHFKLCIITDNAHVQEVSCVHFRLLF